MAAVLAKDFPRYAAVAAPANARDTSGKLLPSYIPDQQTTGFSYWIYAESTGWASADYYVRVGGLHVFISEFGTTFFPRGIGCGQEAIEEYAPGRFRYAIEHMTDQREFGNILLAHLSLPQDERWSISTEQPRVAEYVDNIQGNLTYHETVFDHLFGDTKDENPVKFCFCGGPIQKAGPYQALYETWQRVRDTGFKVSTIGKDFTKPSWNEYFALFDEPGKEKLFRERKDVEDGTMSAFGTRSWGSDLIYLIDAGPIYVAFFADPPNSNGGVRPYCAFEKRPEGYKISGYRVRTLFDALLRSSPIQDALEQIIAKEVPAQAMIPLNP